MLVLSRKLNQCIDIGGDIVITVVEIRPGQVRVGIDAPKDIPIHRREITEAIQRDKNKPEAA